MNDLNDRLRKYFAALPKDAPFDLEAIARAVDATPGDVARALAKLGEDDGSR